MICPICGNKTADGSKACPNCGTAFRYVYDTPAPVVKKKMDIKILILCIVALVILAVILFVVGMKIGDANTDTKINIITQHNFDEDHSKKEPDEDSEDLGITITINGGTGVAAGGTAAPRQQSMADAEEKELTQSSSGLEMPQDGDAVNITKAYNKAINDLRAFRGTVTLKKTETVDIKAKDIPKAVEGVVNGVVQNFLGTTENTYVYNGGYDEGGGPIGERIIPWGRDACVSPADITACSIKENSDGGYTITMTFLAETTVYDGVTTTEPVHHKTAMDPLNLATLDISPLEIFSAEMNYPGATVQLTVDGQGRIVKLHNYLPLNGTGNGGYKVIKLTLGLEGSMDSTYEFKY